MKHCRRTGIFNDIFLCILICFPAFTAAAVLLTGCAGANSENTKSASREFFAMDTIMQITCYGKDCEAAADEAEAEIVRLERLLSIGLADSEVSRINAAGGSASLSDDVRLLVEKSLSLYEMTEGSFDITVLPLMELWGFVSGNYAVPEQVSISAARLLCGSDRIKYMQAQSGLELELDGGQGVDFGGIAKGYAADCLAGIFEKYDLTSAYASLGGNIYCYKNPEGRSWRIAVKNPLHPERSDSFIGVVEVADKSVVTSGGYERCFVDETTGETYHHILDPATGYPAKSGLISVTVVSGSGTLADGLSTACYIMGLEKSGEFWRQYGNGEAGETFGLILMDEQGTVYVTEDIAGKFSSGFDVEIIYK